ncbi:MAG TPA: peptidoglycan-binding domain-containing protein [Acidimicrobiales bacterium]|nr:peptidoglycan-binding domain-containing protein [Acidimicrobiales bacterium]
MAPAPPNLHGGVPVGKGMWIWQPQFAEGGNAQAIVAKAQRYGINYLYVKTGTSKEGFNAAPFLDALLPRAHGVGIKVFGWDFPYLDDIGADVARASQAAHYTTPSGDRIDGFAADIEFRSMGVNLSPDTTGFYGYALRDAVGFGFPLIAVVPRPSPRITSYPYESVVKMFDAIAPMIYWLNNDPALAVQQTWAGLARYGKPIIPVGQAYDGAADGGPPGIPNRGTIHRFMGAVADMGGTSVSFWSWEHASDEIWQAVSDAALFQVPVGDNTTYRSDQIRAYQTLLSSLGFGVPATGVWGPQTDAAVRAFQAASRLPVTGQIDDITRAFLLRPLSPPLK